eukprot:gene7863-biopygen3085
MCVRALLPTCARAVSGRAPRPGKTTVTRASPLRSGDTPWCHPYHLRARRARARRFASRRESEILWTFRSTVAQNFKTTETCEMMILYVIPRPKCRICDFLFFILPHLPRFRQPDANLRSHPPSARPGRAAGGGGRAARGADLRAGMRPGKARKSPTPPPPRPKWRGPMEPGPGAF